MQFWNYTLYHKIHIQKVLGPLDGEACSHPILSESCTVWSIGFSQIVLFFGVKSCLFLMCGIWYLGELKVFVHLGHPKGHFNASKWSIGHHYHLSSCFCQIDKKLWYNDEYGCKGVVTWSASRWLCCFCTVGHNYYICILCLCVLLKHAKTVHSLCWKINHSSMLDQGDTEEL